MVLVHFFLEAFKEELSQKMVIYILSHNHDLPKSGLYGFDMKKGRNVLHFKVDHDPNQDFGEEELEGIDIWYLDADRASEAHKIKGQIHVIMVDVAGIGTDDVYFKHFRVATRDRDKL